MNQVQNRRGEYVPAIPLPLYLGFHRFGCRGGRGKHDRLICKRRFWSKQRYREHYAYAHSLGMD